MRRHGRVTITLLLVTAATHMTGCSTGELSDAGSRVLEITPELATRCDYRGNFTVEIRGDMDYEAARVQAMNEARNKVVARGGDSLLVNSISDDTPVTLRADAYNCPTTRPM